MAQSQWMRSPSDGSVAFAELVDLRLQQSSGRTYAVFPSDAHVGEPTDIMFLEWCRAIHRLAWIINPRPFFQAGCAEGGLEPPLLSGVQAELSSINYELKIEELPPFTEAYPRLGLEKASDPFTPCPPLKNWEPDPKSIPHSNAGPIAPKRTKVNAIICVLTLLELWSESENAVEFLAPMEIVLFGSSVRPRPGYGGTEFGGVADFTLPEVVRVPSGSTSPSTQGTEYAWSRRDGKHELHVLECEAHSLLIHNRPDAAGYASSESSVSTSQGWSREKGSFPEELGLPLDVAVGDGYGESEFVSEQLLVKAAESGTETTSFRIGQICGGTPHGAWATTD
ncbi:hypothetical protein GLOTRDRAFT_139269 [Gloeophyllum trabeum ATCC 11539]|uniref:Thioester reductase (TE) domain-containing protein n=1 Tax=Gloeophyllum trabeum (strain ATCC 11539 / FP-39264 / Madison 617) TaxID=670483 RepID=S7Q5K4_GLOTA|nr:uncharacterized protein GLOTRDRAFT_139269 [Gloeophyllum trabeum ATCC 11539]EPQ54767.1 hypothetical protein GLOTRDRAFT_139269 [Gloeophyllum trabeum ATCC 11539]